MVDYHEEFDFDFLRNHGALDLIAEALQSAAPVIDPWFHSVHPDLFEAPKAGRSSRTSSFGNRRLSGPPRRCSAVRAGKENLHWNATNEGGADPVGISGKGGGAGAGAASVFSPMSSKFSAAREPPSATGAAAKAVGKTSLCDSSIDGSCASGDVLDPMRSRLKDYKLQKMKMVGKQGVVSTGGPAKVRAPAGKPVALQPAGQAKREPLSGVLKPTATSAARQLPVAAGGMAAPVRPVVAKRTGAASTSTSAASTVGTRAKSAAAKPSPVPRLQPVGKASSLSKGSTSSTAAAAKKRAPLPPVSDDEDMNRLVAAHNKRFKPQHTYQPSLSFRATRKWELATGKEYRSLSMADREAANTEILRLEAQEKATKAPSN